MGSVPALEVEVDARSYGDVEEKGGSALRSEGLPRDERIRNPQEFNRIIRSGRWVKGQWIAIYYLPAEDRKVGFGASKKIRKKPAKNRAKRRLRELYRTHKSLFPPGRFIFLALEGADRAPWIALREDFLRTVQKAQTRLWSLS